MISCVIRSCVIRWIEQRSTSTALCLLLTSAGAVALHPAQAQSASCQRDAEFVVRTVEQNYAGFGDKVTPRTRLAYDSATQRLRTAAADSATSALACGRALEQWTAFFRDGHLGIDYQRAAFAGPATPAGALLDTAPAALRARFASAPTRPVSASDVLRELGGASGRVDPIQGIWRTVGAPYRLAVVRDSAMGPDAFVAVVLSADSAWWVPGQVKAVFRAASEPRTTGATRAAVGPVRRYSARYYQRDHTEQLTSARLQNGLLLFAPGWRWSRETPREPGDVSPEAYLASFNGRTALRVLSPRTLLLALPSFNLDSRRAVDSVLRANADAIRHTENLIIDVRGNGGGSDYVFMPVLPFIATGPIRSVNADIYATPLNTATFAAVLQDPRFPASDRPYLEHLVAAMRAHPGQFIPRPDTVFRFDSLNREPKRVAVLTDSGCASSCEEFVLAARQSDRVVLVGTHTEGVLDYANVLTAQTPSGRFVLHYGTSRSHRIPKDPVDPNGIMPQVQIPPDVLFPVDWTQRYLEGHQ